MYPRLCLLLSLALSKTTLLAKLANFYWQWWERNWKFLNNLDANCSHSHFPFCLTHLMWWNLFNLEENWPLFQDQNSLHSFCIILLGKIQCYFDEVDIFLEIIFLPSQDQKTEFETKLIRSSRLGFYQAGFRSRERRWVPLLDAITSVYPQHFCPGRPNDLLEPIYAPG